MSDDYLVLVRLAGTLECIDLQRGTVAWEHSLGRAGAPQQPLCSYRQSIVGNGSAASVREETPVMATPASSTWSNASNSFAAAASQSTPNSSTAASPSPTPVDAPAAPPSLAPVLLCGIAMTSQATPHTYVLCGRDLILADDHRFLNQDFLMHTVATFNSTKTHYMEIALRGGNVLVNGADDASSAPTLGDSHANSPLFNSGPVLAIVRQDKSHTGRLRPPQPSHRGSRSGQQHRHHHDPQSHACGVVWQFECGNVTVVDIDSPSLRTVPGLIDKSSSAATTTSTATAMTISHALQLQPQFLLENNAYLQRSVDDLASGSLMSSKATTPTMEGGLLSFPGSPSFVAHNKKSSGGTPRFAGNNDTAGENDAIFETAGAKSRVHPTHVEVTVEGHWMVHRFVKCAGDQACIETVTCCELGLCGGNTKSAADGLSHPSAARSFPREVVRAFHYCAAFPGDEKLREVPVHVFASAQFSALQASVASEQRRPSEVHEPSFESSDLTECDAVVDAEIHSTSSSRLYPRSNTGTDHGSSHRMADGEATTYLYVRPGSNVMLIEGPALPQVYSIDGLFAADATPVMGMNDDRPVAWKVRLSSSDSTPRLAITASEPSQDAAPSSRLAIDNSPPAAAVDSDSEIAAAIVPPVRSAASMFRMYESDDDEEDSDPQDDHPSRSESDDAERLSTSPGTASSSFLDENFSPLRLLGQGASGVVVLCRQHGTGILYAIKIIVAESKLDEEEVLKEVKLHAPLLCENIVRYHSCWSETVTKLRARQLHELLSKGSSQVYSGLLGCDSMSGTASNLSRQDSDVSDDSSDDDDDEDEDIGGDARMWVGSKAMFLQMEYCNTNLAVRLALRRHVDRVENLAVAVQLFNGVLYLHDHGVVHRDLKPSNVMLLIAPDAEDELDISLLSGDLHAIQRHLQKEADAHAKRAASDRRKRRALRMRASKDCPTTHSTSSSDSDGSSTDDESDEHASGAVYRAPYVVKLGDLGLSKTSGSKSQEIEGYFHNTERHTIGIGSPIYSSPEQLSGKACQPSADVFSLGIMLVEMYMKPSTVSERIDVLMKARSGMLPDTLVANYPELRVARSMLRSDPEARISLSTAKRRLRKYLSSLVRLD